MQKDSWDIDYQSTLNVLEAARANGASHFVLLSAICVQKPLLEFQHAKLKLEAALQAAGDITYSIVRPTAFFKSLAGQVGALYIPQEKHFVCIKEGVLSTPVFICVVLFCSVLFWLGLVCFLAF